MLKRSFKNLLILAFCFFPFFLFAQNLKGVVKTVDGKPVAFARIFLGDSVTQSDKGGQFSFYLKSGFYEIIVDAVGFARFRQKINVDSSQAILDITLYDDKETMDEVVITSSKNLVSKNYVPVNVSIINKEQIEKSGESALLPVLMHNVPGLFVTQRGVTGFGVGAGSAGAISMRGISGSPNNRVLVLINGNPQFMGIFGHPLPDAYVASDVQKVEVIQGAGSVLYGTNAMGGVINIITKDQVKNGYAVNGKLSFGSFNTQKYMLSGGFKKNRFSLQASYNKDHSNGHRDNSFFDINNGMLKMKFEASKHFVIGLENNIAQFKAADPGPAGGNKGETIDILRGATYFFLSNKYDRMNGNIQLFLNYGKHKITDGFRSRDVNMGFTMYESFKVIKGNTTTVGFDYKNYGGKAENIFAMNGQGILFGDKSIAEWAPYIYTQQNFKKLIVSAGFRIENNNVYGNIPVTSAGLSYIINQKATVKASYSKGFRSPTIMELYLFPPANDELKPEKMTNFEISFLYRLLNNKLKIDLTLFNVKGNNLIQTVFQNGAPKNINTGMFNNTGIEFSGNYAVSNHLSLAINYSYIAFKEKILGSPKSHLEIIAGYRLKKFDFGINISSIQGLYKQISPSLVTANYALINVKSSYNINSSFSVFLKGENLTDQSYEINYGYPMPGITIFGGLNFNLSKLK